MDNIEKIINWYNYENDRIFIISGYAGCGKTTLARKVPEILNLLEYNVAFLTPTGKAAKVLHSNAKTIHSYLYFAKLDENNKLIFVKKHHDEFTEDLLIVDEISMVSDDLLKDLINTGIPIIGLGDPAQLPPVFGTSTILENPDIFLTHVFRNDGGLLDFATDVRMDKIIKTSYENVMFKRNNIVRDLNLIDEDSIVICRYNKTRNNLNKIIREKIYHYTHLIDVGEKLMVLRNNKSTGLMNGSIVQIVEIININDSYNFAEVIVLDDNGNTQKIYINTHILADTTNKLSANYQTSMNIHIVDYAYAITCHKSQGSEFEKVFVVVEGTQYDDFKKWLYTAITRARKSLYMYK